jgi:hypothetical protein
VKSQQDVPSYDSYLKEERIRQLESARSLRRQPLLDSRSLETIEQRQLARKQILKTIPEMAMDSQREKNGHEFTHTDRILGKQPIRKRWMDSKLETIEGSRVNSRKSNGPGDTECVSRVTLLPFKNGRDKEIGRLIFDQWSPGTRIRSPRLRNPTILTAQWEAYSQESELPYSPRKLSWIKKSRSGHRKEQEDSSHGRSPT